MAEIIPAIMPKSYDELEEKVSSLLGVVPVVQIDLMDGIFVKSKSWPYLKGELVPDYLPNIHEIDYEIDLMVKDPRDRAHEWVMAGAKRIIPHLEAFKNPADDLADLRHDDVELGIAVNTTTSNEKIEEVIGLVDFVQFMGIERIGYQGEVFDERVVGKIISLRDKNPEIIISVDGGVSLLSAPELIEAGANRLVSGSTIWKSDNIEETIESLKELV
ncbi:hypothetical protein CL631_01090 [bacterium]|jgi:ribulose-phosphate 3-epimerase|nr:hypothetical protein [bacterium]MDP6659824.1 hypothetical protein [Candidatus Paceibacterota bacterium]|tara:strand:- start:47994 stop:48644 length:651 start_codon:yes stop_codon:yes gene_type:complete